MLVDGLFGGHAECFREFLIDLQADAGGVDVTAGISQVGDGERGLQHVGSVAVDIELAAGEPAEVARVGSVKQQERGLPVGGGEVERDRALALNDPALKAHLRGDLAENFRFQFEQEQFMSASLNHLHENTMLAQAGGGYSRKVNPERLLMLFDIDGTLLRRAGPHHRQALVEAVRLVTGLESTTDGIAVQGMLDRKILEMMLQQAGARQSLIRSSMNELVRQAQAVYLRTCPATLVDRTCPGARALLSKLRRRGVPAGLVTGNLTRIGWRKMQRAGLRRYFSFGAFAELAEDRAGLVRIAIRRAHALGCGNGASRVWLVGDHPNDIAAAKANGVGSIAVCTGLSSRSELGAHHPDLLLDDLRSLKLEMLHS